MKATFGLSIPALIALAGCAAETGSVATTTTRQVTREPSGRIPIENHTIPREVWWATSASIGKDIP